jgi:predicted amidohydrolase
LEFAVALVQMSCLEGRREENQAAASRALANISLGKGVRFIVFPELFDIGFDKEDYPKAGPGVPGPTSVFLERVAKKYASYVVGTGLEKANATFYNTLAVASPSGKTFVTYRKIHPFQTERAVFKGGDRTVLFDAEGIKVGVEICYDIRFPELTRRIALEGAQLVLVPGAFPDPRSAHWDTLLAARAIENQLYVAAANRVGRGFDGKTYFGHSQTVDPWGVRMTRMTSEEQVFVSSGDTRCVDSVREQITCYKDRTPAAYEQVQWFREH